MGSIREYIKDDGTKSYHAEVRLRGYPQQRETFRTKSQAKQWIQDTESAIRDGRHFKTAEAKRHTVGEMIDRFINQWLPKYPKRQAKQTALLTWWKSRLGHLLLADLAPSAIAEARDFLLSGTTIRNTLRTPSTVKRYLAALSKTLTVCVKEWGWLDDSPMRKVTMPPENKGRERLLTPEEKSRLLDACKASPNKYLYPFATLLLLGGLRYSEANHLRWSSIQFESKKIIIPETKNGKCHIIPLTDVLESILKDFKRENEGASDLLFPAKRKDSKSGASAIRKAFVKVIKACGIENFRIHDIRHAAASYMAMNGATQGELMAFLNHTSPAMTRRYAHYSQKHLADLMQRTQSKLLQEEEKLG